MLEEIQPSRTLQWMHIGTSVCNEGKGRALSTGADCDGSTESRDPRSPEDSKEGRGQGLQRAGTLSHLGTAGKVEDAQGKGWSSWRTSVQSPLEHEQISQVQDRLEFLKGTEWGEKRGEGTKLAQFLCHLNSIDTGLHPCYPRQSHLKRPAWELRLYQNKTKTSKKKKQKTTEEQEKQN